MENENYIQLVIDLSSLPRQRFSLSLVLKWRRDTLPLLHVFTSAPSLVVVPTSVLSWHILLKLDSLLLLKDFTSCQTKRTYFRRSNMDAAARSTWTCLRTAQPWIHRGTRVRPGRQPLGWRRSKPGTTPWSYWSSSASCCSTCSLTPSVSCWWPNLLSSWYFSCESAVREVLKTHLNTEKTTTTSAESMICVCSSHTFSSLTKYAGHCHPPKPDHHSVDAVQHLRVPGRPGRHLVGAV